MRFGSFEHKPSFVILILYLLFTAALLFLGTWQMQRAATKVSILDAAAASRSVAPVNPSSITDVGLAATEHTLVTFSGAYRGDRQFLWDNRVHKGQAGFEVITPVDTGDGIVLVNRGWVAPGATRENLPDVALADDLVNTTVTITGLFSRPSKGFASGEAFGQNEPWPRVLQYFDYDAIEQALDNPVLAGVVQPQQKLSADDATWNSGRESAAGDQERTKAIKDANERADLYIANWEPAASIGPARHYGYAFQWYAMAAALSILYIVYNTRRIAPTN